MRTRFLKRFLNVLIVIAILQIDLKIMFFFFVCNLLYKQNEHENLKLNNKKYLFQYISLIFLIAGIFYKRKIMKYILKIPFIRKGKCD